MLAAVALLLLQTAAPARPFSAPRCGSEMALEKQVQPTYPYLAQRNRIQGQVQLEALVGADGSVKEVAVVSGEKSLAEAAADAVHRWKYHPCEIEGKPVEVSVPLVLNFAFKANVSDTAPPPPGHDAKDPAANAPPAVQRVRVSGGVTQGNLVHKVQPLYPLDAKAGHVQGAVVLHAIIGTDGRIKNLEVIAGNPSLARAAVGAVQQWRYKPYMLKGNPVEVDTTITVNFQLLN